MPTQFHGLDDLSKGKIWLIPRNQRGYSWGATQINELFSDLELLLQNKHHFLGPIITTRVEENSFYDSKSQHTHRYTVEDGQQRLTTFIILIHNLKVRFEEIDPSRFQEEIIELNKILFYQTQSGETKHRYENENPQLNSFFTNLVGNNNPNPTNSSQQKLTEAMALGRQKFKDLEENELNDFKRLLIDCSKFQFIDLSSESVDRYIVFETINSRGLPLTQFDAIKNYSLLIWSRDNSDPSRQHLSNLNIENEWFDAIMQLDRFNVSDRNNENTFINDVFNMFFSANETIDNTHKAFVKLFSGLLQNSNPDLEDQFRRFIGLWKPLAQSFGFVHVPPKQKSKRQAETDYVSNGPLASNTSYQLLTKRDNMGLRDITRMLLTICHRVLDQNHFEEICRFTEIFTFRIYAVQKTRVDAYKIKFIQISNFVLHAHHQNYTSHDICEKVKQHLCFMLDGDKYSASLQDCIETLLNERSKKYYYAKYDKGWKHLYYFLYEYENYLAPTNTPIVDFEESKTDIMQTIEHILPQTFYNEAAWHYWDKDEGLNAMHRLGNLALTVNNSSLAAKGILLKIHDPNAEHDYSRQRATLQESRISNYVDNNNEWTNQSIRNRASDLAAFFIERWKLPCCSDNGQFEFGEIYNNRTKIVNYTECTNSEEINVDEFDETNEE